MRVEDLFLCVREKKRDGERVDLGGCLCVGERERAMESEREKSLVARKWESRALVIRRSHVAMSIKPSLIKRGT